MNQCALDVIDIKNEVTITPMQFFRGKTLFLQIIFAQRIAALVGALHNQLCKPFKSLC